MSFNALVASFLVLQIAIHQGACRGCKIITSMYMTEVSDVRSSAKLLLLQEAMDETFLLSNIAPQVGDGFNRHCTLFSVSLERVFGLTPWSDWAYLEDWCRRLTGNFQDVYIFTVPLYLPRKDSDGKWRVVSIFEGKLKLFI